MGNYCEKSAKLSPSNTEINLVRQCKSASPPRDALFSQ